jgi:hypothetical protein
MTRGRNDKYLFICLQKAHDAILLGNKSSQENIEL